MKIPLFSLVLILLSVSIVCAAPPAPWEIDELVGNTAPDFTLTDINNKKVSLYDYRGKVVLMNFWASWCPPCKEEMPDLRKLTERYKGRNFAIISISTDNSMEDVIDFAKKYKLNFTVLHDGDNKVSRKYKVFSIPISFLIDKRGRIMERYLGVHEWFDEDFLKKVENLM